MKDREQDKPSVALARFAHRMRLADVPKPVVDRAKLHLLDAIGLAFASTVQGYARSTIAGMAAIGGNGSGSIIGRPERMQLRDAALVNAILIHGLDFDDTHLASIIHPTCTSLPTAMALGEALESDGATLLEAFLVGAEIAIRIGAAVNGGFHHVGYHATGVVSHFAAAITAAKLLDLGEARTVAALGIVGSTASGIQVFLEEGSWTKRFHPGWGAVAGITAAYLAKEDFKGPSRPLEGRFGLFDTHLQAHAKDVRSPALVDGLGDEWLFGDTALKPYPVCHFIHGCADAAVDLHAEIGGAEILSVTAYLPEPTLHIIAEPAQAKERPTTEYEVKFSAQFVIAACLLNGRFGLPDLKPEAIADPGIRALAPKVKCQEDPDSRFPTYFSGGVTVVLGDGRTLRRHVPVNSGAGERAMTTDAVVSKFMASATIAIPGSRAARISETVLTLESADTSALMELLRD